MTATPIPEGAAYSSAPVLESAMVGRVKKPMLLCMSWGRSVVARLGSSQVPMLYMAALPEVNRFWASV